MQYHRPLGQPRGARILLRSGCTGIGSFELATRCAAKKFNTSVTSAWAAEKDACCVEELLSQPSHHRPLHVFSNWLGFLQPGVKQALLAMDPENIAGRRDMVMNNTTCTMNIWCMACGKSCNLARCHVHCSGVPCVHDSSWGKHDKLAGDDAFVLWIALRQRLGLLEPLACFECVPQQGIAEYERNLGSHYYVERVTFCPSTLGWRSRRPRQYVVCTLKGLNIPIRGMTISNFIEDACTRGCTYTPLEYCVADERDKEFELSWVRERKEASNTTCSTTNSVMSRL